MDLLGIDERGKNLKIVRDWYGVRNFFKLKLPKIDYLCEQLKSGNGKDCLYSAMLKEKPETLRPGCQPCHFSTTFWNMMKHKATDYQIRINWLMLH